MTENNHNLVKFFREAAPYIHMHRGKTFVIAISGEVLQHKKAGEIISDIAILSSLGSRIILVHGARPQIEEQLEKNGHKTTIHNGLRITDDETLEISKASAGSTRLEIENLLNRALNRPPVVNSSLGVVSGNFITARPIGVIDGIDYQHTGKIRKAKRKLLKSLLRQGNIILISPLGYSPTGQIYNIRYVEIAGYLAAQVNADKLIFIHNDETLSKLPKHSNLGQFDRDLKVKKDGVLDEISRAMHEGVERVHLVDAKTQASLLLELYTRDGVGSMLSKQRYDEPRQAEIDDINGIVELIRPLEAQGILAKRNRSQLELGINNFIVIERDGLIIGCAALYPIDETDTGELSCLAIHKNYRSGNRGAALVKYITERARNIELRNLFVLTTQSIDWFLEQGFEEKNRTSLPQQRKDSYNPKRNSKVLFLKLIP